MDYGFQKSPFSDIGTNLDDYDSNGRQQPLSAGNLLTLTEVPPDVGVGPYTAEYALVYSNDVPLDVEL